MRFECIKNNTNSSFLSVVAFATKVAVNSLLTEIFITPFQHEVE